MFDELDATAIRIVEPKNEGNPKKQAVLLVMSGPTTGQAIYLESKDSWKVGRALESDILLQDDSVSRNHCRLSFSDPDRWTIEDLNSANGTWINGERVTNVILSSGDKIHLGTNFTLKFVLQDQLESAFQKELYESATKDSLTGLHSKRFFTEQIEMEFNHHKRMLSPLSVVFLDIDHFKQINDTHGHPAGDFVLKHLGLLVADVLRRGEVAGRFGGEEFVFSLRETTLQGAVEFAERLRKRIEAFPFVFEGKKIPVTASFGAATYDKQNYRTAPDLLKAADEQLYRAKKSGRNRVACAESK